MELNKEVYDCSTGELSIYPLNPQEIAARKKAQEIADKESVEFDKKVVARNELLEKLGITEEEAKLLLS